MKKGWKITGAAIGIALILTTVLGTTVFADPGDGECTACTEEYAGEKGPRGINGMGEVSMGAVGELLGLTDEELHELREDGYSLAEIAEANGVTVDELVETIMTAKTAELETKVSEGTLTREQAESMIQRMEERTLRAVNRTAVGPAEFRGELGNKAGGLNSMGNQARGRGGFGMRSQAGGTCDGTATSAETGTMNRWGSNSY